MNSYIYGNETGKTSPTLFNSSFKTIGKNFSKIFPYNREH